MASDLLSIGKSGVMAARGALNVTAQNVANASTQGYVRRSVLLSEASSLSTTSRAGDVSLSGVRLDRIVRNADVFRQTEVRRTGADLARAEAEANGLENIETAIEQSGLYDAVVGFDGSLRQLASDPIDHSLRASVIESARTMTRTLNIAAQSLEQAGQGLRFEATDATNQINILASELARVNLSLARAADASSDETALLDQRDHLLDKITQYVDVTTVLNGDQTVSVRIGGSSGPELVVGGRSSSLAMDAATDGTILFTLDGTPVNLLSGGLVGKQQALEKLKQIRTGLDAIASSLIATANSVQLNGVDLNGMPGTTMFSGNGAADIKLVLEDGARLATAPAGASAGSRDQSDLAALILALENAAPAGKVDALIFDISSAVRSSKVTRDAVETIANTAKIALVSQSGVSLDSEAANLVRYQQAFQASARVMQIAREIFDTIVAIK